MNVFNVVTENGEPIVVMESRNFKMKRVLKEVVKQPDNIAYLSAVRCVGAEHVQYNFEINLENDPDFDKWDEKLFEDAVNHYCKYILQLDQYSISFVTQWQLCPYLGFGDELETESTNYDNIEPAF